MNSGVYCIYSKVENKPYYGSSNNLKKRLREHKRQLKLGIHANWKLQKSYNKNGFDSFNFKVENYCPPEYRKKLEQKYLDTFLKAQEAIKGTSKDFWKLGYNLNPDTESWLVTNLDSNSIKEGRKKFSEGVKSGKYKVGREKFSDKEKEELSNRISRPINQYTLTGVFIQEWKGLKEAENNLDIKASHIGQVCRKELEAAKGFVFRYKDDPSKVYPIKNYRRSPRNRKVGLFNIETNNFETVYTNREDASNKLGYTKSTIKSHIHKNQLIKKKYYLKYINND